MSVYPNSPVRDSMEFSRQEYWSELPFPSPGESSQPRDQTQVFRIAGVFFTSQATRETQEWDWEETEFGVAKRATLWTECWGDKRDIVRERERQTETETERSRVQSLAEY